MNNKLFKNLISARFVILSEAKTSILLLHCERHFERAGKGKIV